MLKKGVFLLMGIMLVLIAGCLGQNEEELEFVNGDEGYGVEVERVEREVLSIKATGKSDGIILEVNDDLENQGEIDSDYLYFVETFKNSTRIILTGEKIDEGTEILRIRGFKKSLNIVVLEKESFIENEKFENSLKRAEVENKLLGDFNGDNIVDIEDLNMFSNIYGKSYNSSYDVYPAQKGIDIWEGIYSIVDADGGIDLFDFIIFGRNFNKEFPGEKFVERYEITGEIQVEEGSELSLIATAYYNDGSSSEAGSIWSSSNEEIATVRYDFGTVTGRGSGIVNIEATHIDSGFKANKEIEVIKKEEETGINIYYKSSATPDIWIWEANDGYAISEEMGYTWTTRPSMERVPDTIDWYVYNIPQKIIASKVGTAYEGDEITLLTENLHIMFNGGGEVIAEPNTAWYDGEAWYLENPDDPMAPLIEVSPRGGEIRGDGVVDIDIMGPDLTDIRIELNGQLISELSNYSFQVSEVLENGETGELTVAATNPQGEDNMVRTYTRNDDLTLDFTWDNATVYFVMTDRFKDGDSTNNNSYGRPQVDAWGNDVGTFHGGDLAGLTEKLNEGYFENLGVNAIWITAAYEQIHGWVGGGADGDFAHYAYHGYYPLDWTMVDKNMGTVTDMRNFVDTAHSQGIRVVMDIVMNHAGYHTIKDMDEFGFGSLEGVDGDWTPSSSETWHDAPDYMTGGIESDWQKWWGSEWVYARISEEMEMPGYEINGDVRMLYGLPDLKVGLDDTAAVNIPTLLDNKWNQSGTDYSDWIVPAAEQFRQSLDASPADYLTSWISSWVREFGIDGFRIDTAKHIPADRWKELHIKANNALWEWRENNPDKDSAVWRDDFWMTGEDWGHGIGKSHYPDYGFSSMINFNFQGQGGGGPAYNSPSEMESTYSNYADTLNTDPDWNVLSYISQHDTQLYDRSNLINGGTNLLLLPGGIQIFYGDEVGRVAGEGLSDGTQGNRSSMDWDNLNQEVLQHWQKVGQFRRDNVAVGAGDHNMISSSPYTFSRIFNKDGFKNEVVVSIVDGVTDINVGEVFSDGVSLRNAYNGEIDIVEDGLVTFTGENGVILIEETE